MLHIGRAQMARVEEIYFYARLGRFIRAHCRNAALPRWLSSQPPKPPLWHQAWQTVRTANEHDCALVLVFLSVCECEGHEAGPADALLASLPGREVAIKRFLEEKGYFPFSAFEFSVPGVE